MTEFTNEQLEAELVRRKLIANTPPVPLKTMDFSRLIVAAIDGIEDAAKNQYMDDDLKTYIWETALECVYGKDFWEWRGKQRW